MFGDVAVTSLIKNLSLMRVRKKVAGNFKATRVLTQIKTSILHQMSLRDSDGLCSTKAKSN